MASREAAGMNLGGGGSPVCSLPKNPSDIDLFEHPEFPMSCWAERSCNYPDKRGSWRVADSCPATGRRSLRQFQCSGQDAFPLNSEPYLKSQTKRNTCVYLVAVSESKCEFDPA